MVVFVGEGQGQIERKVHPYSLYSEDLVRAIKIIALTGILQLTFHSMPKK